MTLLWNYDMILQRLSSAEPNFKLLQNSAHFGLPLFIREGAEVCWIEKFGKEAVIKTGSFKFSQVSKWN